jgi:type II secretory ATPase GspE/PulE/Tfp pilus assembly ATPase PilB-like protein
MVLMVSAAAIFYITKRNAVVPSQHQLFGAHHLERMFGGVPLLNKLATMGSRPEVERLTVPLVNARGVYLSSLMAEQQAFAQPAAILGDFVVRAGTTQTRKIRLVSAGDSYVAQFLMDGVVHNAETFEPEVGQQVLACASVFLGLTSEGRVRQGSGTLTAEMAGGERAEVTAEITAVEGKPALVLDFPNWTADLYKKGLESLGMHGAVLKRLQTAATQSKGAVVVCGPAGSGKTTTLYGISSLIDIFTTEVIAVEKKPEYELQSIRRWPLAADKPISQVFAELLREAPQAIMWGEVTQAEQASPLLQFASEEGLVLTTMRAADAAGALIALAKLTDDARLVGRAVSCVVSQRLARRLCVSCREPVEPDAALLAKLKLDPAAPGQWFRPVGCPACLGCGFRGQIGIYEMLIVTEPVAKALAAGSATPTVVRQAAGEGALRSMYQDGLTKVTAGITTLEEIRRVLTQPVGRTARKAGESQ